MTILRNAAKCTVCGTEIESTHRHDFKVHYCDADPTPEMEWEEDTLVPTGKTTWRFAVDGGKEYIRRCGTGYTDISEFSTEKV